MVRFFWRTYAWVIFELDSPSSEFQIIALQTNTYVYICTNYLWLMRDLFLKFYFGLYSVLIKVFIMSSWWHNRVICTSCQPTYTEKIKLYIYSTSSVFHIFFSSCVLVHLYFLPCLSIILSSICACYSNLYI